jgi:cytochrome oxidase assembly protein ShyY1
MTNDHLGYALTWYGLALALAAVSAMLVWRHFRPGPPELVPSPPEP